MDVSVIIPTYNRLWCLPEAIESCIGGHCRVEIIVIDDGSTDGTIEWLNGRNDIVVLSQNHLGKCWAVNAAFGIAKGKYVRFLDSDDLINKNANDEQFVLAENTSADIVVSGYQVFSNKANILKEQAWIASNDYIAQQLGECDSSHYSSYLFKKAFISDIPHRPDYALRDDRLFVLECALKNPVVTVHQGTALLHRVEHNDRLQISSGIKFQLQNYQHLNIYKYILNRLKNNNELSERRINAATNILWPLAHWTAKTHLKEAVEIVKWIYELNPNFIPPEKGSLGFMYSKLGFKTTEKILWIRRLLKYGI
jgi:glycosyltransferase involved in cell wall biosynthesis